MIIIDDFHGDFLFLSNFYEHEFWWNGLFWKSSEHAYQASKTLNEAWVTKIQHAKTPGESKKLGRQCPYRDDWDEIKLLTMYRILEAKFEDRRMRQMLLATEDAILIEGNTWGDTFWGVCDGRGYNALGTQLMILREHLKTVAYYE